MLTQRSLKLGPLHTMLLPLCGSAESAYAHLCDHVLTRPEAHYWALLIPAFRDFLDPEDDDALLAFARRLWVEGLEGASVLGEQVLFDGYAATTQAALEQAATHRLHWQEKDQLGRISGHALGKCGVYVIWDRSAVDSAMVQAFAARPRGGRPSPAERRINPLPRRGTWVASAHSPKAPPPAAADPEAARDVCFVLFRRALVKFRREYRQACGDRAKRVVQHPGPLLYLGQVAQDRAWAEWDALACSPDRPGCRLICEGRSE